MQEAARPRRDSFSPTKTVITLLDMKRSANVEIMLSKLGAGVSPEEIAQAVAQLDCERLTLEHVDQMLRYIPTDEEKLILRGFLKKGGDRNDLGKAEKYFLALAGVDRFQSRLWALQFKLAFDANAQDLAAAMGTIRAASEQALGSKRLQGLMQVVLAVGNTLNAGRGPVNGFRIESLQKLSDTRSFDGKTTLLHYIVSHCERRQPDMLKVDEDVPALAHARRTFASLQEDLAPLQRGLVALKGALCCPFGVALAFL